MNFFISDEQLLHKPSIFIDRGKVVRSEDRIERITLLQEGALRADLKPMEAKKFPLATKQQVHTSRYLKFLRNIDQISKMVKFTVPLALFDCVRE